MKESILLTSDEVLSRLAEGPPRISTAADGLSAKQLRTSPDDGWSANEVLAHLRACGDVWGGHIIAIVEEDRPTRQGISPRTWMKKTNYTELDFRESFAAFSAQRAELLHVLDELTPEDWSRTALIKSYASRTNEHSALFFADGLARHERVHVKQFEQVAEAIRAS